MDNVYRERVTGIRERVGHLMDRRGECATIYQRHRFASWLEHRRDDDAEVLAAVTKYAPPEVPHD